MPRLLPSHSALTGAAYARIVCAAGVAACLSPYSSSRGVSTGRDAAWPGSASTAAPPADKQRRSDSAAASNTSSSSSAGSAASNAASDSASSGTSSNAASSTLAPLCVGTQKHGVRTARVDTPRWAAAFYGNVPEGLLSTGMMSAAPCGWGSNAANSGAGASGTAANGAAADSAVGASRSSREDVTWDAICASPQMQSCFPLLTQHQRLVLREQQQQYRYDQQCERQQQQQQQGENEEQKASCSHFTPRQRVRAALPALACSRAAHQLAAAAGHMLLPRALAHQRRRRLDPRTRGCCYRRPQPFNWAGLDVRQALAAAASSRDMGSSSEEPGEPELVSTSEVTVSEDGQLTLTVTRVLGPDGVGWDQSSDDAGSSDEDGDEGGSEDAWLASLTQPLNGSSSVSSSDGGKDGSIEDVLEFRLDQLVKQLERGGHKVHRLEPESSDDDGPAGHATSDLCGRGSSGFPGNSSDSSAEESSDGEDEELWQQERAWLEQQLQEEGAAGVPGGDWGSITPVTGWSADDMAVVQQPGVFRTEQNVIFGFWSKVPMG